jgi:hypothetical protein
MLPALLLGGAWLEPDPEGGVCDCDQARAIANTKINK